jgi:hypothetical protein
VCRKHELKVCLSFIDRLIYCDKIGEIFDEALDLFPIVFAIMHWGLKYNPNTDMSIPIMKELTTDEKGLEQRLLRNFDDIY